MSEATIRSVVGSAVVALGSQVDMKWRENMRAIVILGALLLAANLASARDSEGHEHGAASTVAPTESDGAVVVEPNQALVQVNGVVCSFCAYGVEKSLSELDALDRTEFGDGVLVDIDKHRIVLALRPGEKLPIRDIYERIKKAGYDPVTFYLRSAGVLERRGETLLLRDADSGQVFSIVGDGLQDLADGARVEVQAQADASQIPSLEEGDAVEVIVDRLISDSERQDG